MKKLICYLCLAFVLFGCGGGGSDTTTGSGTTTCTGQQIAGKWLFTVSVAGLSESTTITFDGSETVTSNTFTETEDGITFSGTFNGECNSVSGTIVDNESGLDGTFTGTKL